MKKISLLLCLVALLSFGASAQRYIGISTSNWSGTNSLYLNPANAADSRHKFTIDLFSLNVGLDNNLAKINTSEAIKYINDPNNNDISKAYTFGNNDKFSLMAPYAEIRGPGAMVSIGRKHGLALTTRVRAFNQFHDFNKNLYRTIVDQDFRNSASSNYVVNSGNSFNYTTHAWTEIGLTYGGVLYDGGKHFVKGGLTVRYLMGAGYVSLTSANINAVSYGAQDSVVVTNSNMKFGTTIANGEFGTNVNDYLFGSAGKGVGGDFGFVYEWRPNHAKYRYDMDGDTNIVNDAVNKYKLRFSVAVTDFGVITYEGKNNFDLNITGNGYIKGATLADSIGSYNSLRNYAKSHGFGVDSSTGQRSTNVVLPTALVTNVDYHAVKNLYINAMFIANVANRNVHGNTIYSQLTVTPRWDTRVFSVGVPITYNFLAKNVRAGLGARVGGFFVGSDDIAGLFSNSTNGFNFYFGASIPFNKKKPKDTDGDLVSNKKDKCKKEKGTWELRGCPIPDQDGDGILDSVDKCPQVPGVASADGCPDADGDGIADGEDRCPEKAGPEEYQGCPDTDSDGIVDIEDACPTVPGLAQYGGCPDSDGDGIIDGEDRCPEVAGPASNQGCPEITVEEKKTLEFAATAIEFDLGKASIRKGSHELLDKIVEILNNHPEYDMTIDGHTDASGSDAVNLKLSKERANAVKAYFESKGIASSRLKAEGYGESQPVADNKTRAGRAKNRRVVMDMKLR
ncbi:MAG: OmpA family protein [Flavipsychrobacter sp.]